jgi:uncharacterized protein
MRVIQGKDHEYLVACLDKGERFPHAFQAWLLENNVKGAFFYGIGGATAIRCGFYKLSTKEYIFKDFSGDHLEIVNITGDVAMLDGSLKIHAHLTFADEQLHVYGGHLDSLTVGATFEIYVQILDAMSRKKNEEVGLPLLQE